MKKIFALIAVLLYSAAATAQTVQQSPVFVTPGHVATWVTNGVIGDAGSAQAPVITSLGTVGQGSTICANSGPQTGPYNQLCLGANLGSAAQITLQSFGGASNQNINFVINGTSYAFPFVATGVVGPATTVIGDFVCWANLIGTLTSDCSTFASYKLTGSSTGITSLVSGNASATNYTATFPANTGTIAELNLAQTWTAAQTFTNSDIILLGSSTGFTTFASANSGASNFTITFPATTGTVALTSGVATSVSNSDGTLTISPNSGVVVASLNLGHVQTWTGAQTFTNSDILLLGSSTGATTFTSANSSGTNYTATVPANTGTIAELNLAQTWTAAQTFTNSDILLLGSSTGATTFTSGNSSGTNYTVTIPANTGTVAELNLAQTWTASQNLASGTVLSWNSDTGISRGAAATLDVGNGTAADVSGTIVAAHATLNALANTATTSAVCYNTGTGVLTYDSTIGTCNTSSIRFKHNIQPFTENALSAVLRMRPKTFLYNDDQHTYGQQIGLIAEDLAAIDPRLVSYDDSGQPNAIRYLGPMFSYLIGAIQQQQHEIDNLKRRVH